MPPMALGCRSRRTLTDYHWNEATPDQIHVPTKAARPKCVPDQRLPDSSAYTPLCWEEISPRVNRVCIIEGGRVHYRVDRSP